MLDRGPLRLPFPGMPAMTSAECAATAADEGQDSLAKEVQQMRAEINELCAELRAATNRLDDQQWDLMRLNQWCDRLLHELDDMKSKVKAGLQQIGIFLGF